MGRAIPLLGRGPGRTLIRRKTVRPPSALYIDSHYTRLMVAHLTRSLVFRQCSSLITSQNPPSKCLKIFVVSQLRLIAFSLHLELVDARQGSAGGDGFSSNAVRRALSDSDFEGLKVRRRRNLNDYDAKWLGQACYSNSAHPVNICFVGAQLNTTSTFIVHFSGQR